MVIDEIAAKIEAMPEYEIAPIAEQALEGRAAAEDLSWDAERLNALSVGNGTIGLWKVTGTASNGADWSAVVKVLDPANKRDRSGTFQTARKEIDALQSSDLLSVESGMRPVPVYRLSQEREGYFWLWMKDLSRETQPPWDAEHFTIAARHIGQFNGLWPQDYQPQGSWIATDMSNDRRSDIISMYAPGFSILRGNTDHSYVKPLAQQFGLERLLSLTNDAETLLRATSTLPRSVAHNDCHARNLFPSTHNGIELTYAIDWASVGLVSVGVDCGTMVGSSTSWGWEEAETVGRIEREVFEAYVTGLRDSGWNGDTDAVRLAYLSSVTSYVMGAFWVVGMMVEGGDWAHFLKKRMGTDEAGAVSQAADRIATFIPLVDEGLELAGC